jgi:hypothetical protein
MHEHVGLRCRHLKVTSPAEINGIFPKPEQKGGHSIGPPVQSITLIPATRTVEG